MQKREIPAGSPPPVGFASFHRTITEFTIAELTQEVKTLVPLCNSICRAAGEDTEEMGQKIIYSDSPALKDLY